MESSARAQQGVVSDAPRKADKATIEAALLNLTVTELAKLKAIARSYTHKSVLRESDEDLLQTAIARTCDGSRPWYTDATETMFQHLNWAIKNIAWEWRRKLLITDAETGEVEQRLISGTSPDGSDLFDKWHSPQRDIADTYPATECVERIFRELDDDIKAIEILECRFLGFNGSETQAMLSISQTDYETIMRRVRRKFAHRKWISY